jgi:glyoxylate reductase
VQQVERPKVYITRKISDEAVKKLIITCDVSMWDEEDIPVPRDVLADQIVEMDGLLCLLTDTIDEALINRATKLKVISNFAVGTNNIDIAAAAKKGIIVTNTPDVLTESTADLTFALLMAAARRMVEATDYLRLGEWKSWAPQLLTGMDVYGSTMGIIGLGRIGEALAKRGKGFEMKVLYHSRSRKPEAENNLGITYVDMETLLKESDFVCIMTPYTPETHNLIGAAELSLMKHTAVLINTARGGIVNEEALYYALKNGTIWAAGLDVFEQEPISQDHSFFKLTNIVMLPHIGSASIKTRNKMADIAAENVIRVLANQPPLYRVKPQ